MLEKEYMFLHYEEYKVVLWMANATANAQECGSVYRASSLCNLSKPLAVLWERDWKRDGCYFLISVILMVSIQILDQLHF